MPSPYGICDPGLHPEELKQRVCDFLGIPGPCNLPLDFVYEQYHHFCLSQTRAKVQQHILPSICEGRYVSEDEVCRFLPHYCGLPLFIVREKECPRRAEAFVKSQQSEQMPASPLFGRIKQLCDAVEPSDVDEDSIFLEVMELCNVASKIKESVQMLPPFEGEIKEIFEKVEETVTNLCYPMLDPMQIVEEVRRECTEWKDSPPQYGFTGNRRLLCDRQPDLPWCRDFPTMSTFIP